MTNFSENSHVIVHLSRYKCWVRVFEGRLEICRSLGDESALGATKEYRRWERARHPVGQDFLDQVNRVLDTNYTERHFQVESWNEKGRPPPRFYTK